MRDTGSGLGGRACDLAPFVSAHHRAAHIGVMREDDAAVARAMLLDWVADESAEPHAAVDLRPFWVEYPFSAVEQCILVEPLVATGVLRDATPREGRRTPPLSDAGALPCRRPERVVLNPRDRRSMLAGTTATRVIASPGPHRIVHGLIARMRRR